MKDDIDPAIGAMMEKVFDWLDHEQSVFRTLDITPLMIQKGRSRFSFLLTPEFCGSGGKAHSSLMTIIIDSICGLTALTALDQIQPIATINLRTDYLADIGPATRVICAARCIKIRDDIAHMTAKVSTECGDQLLATGTGAFLIGARGAPQGARI